MYLPQKLPLPLMQTQWAAQINPVIEAVQNNSLILERVKLVSGSNVINHQLGRDLQGWKIVRKRTWFSTGTATVYDVSDTQDSNNMPSLTLFLHCTEGTLTNPVIIDLEVF